MIQEGKNQASEWKKEFYNSTQRSGAVAKMGLFFLKPDDDDTPVISILQWSNITVLSIRCALVALYRSHRLAIAP